MHALFNPGLACIYAYLQYSMKCSYTDCTASALSMYSYKGMHSCIKHINISHTNQLQDDKTT